MLLNGENPATVKSSGTTDIAFVAVAGELDTHVQAINEVDVSVDVSADTTVDAHIEAINILLPKLEEITDELEEAVGGHILAIKRAEPNNWEKIVKVKCGLSRSRAYQLMRIADGTKSSEQSKREANARLIKHRQKRAVRFATDRKELVAAQAQITELEAAHARQIERFKLKLAQLGDAGTLRSERDGFRSALGRVEKLLAEARGLTTHYAHNQADIKARINRALTVARSALQVKATAGNPADSSEHAA